MFSVGIASAFNSGSPKVLLVPFDIVLRRLAIQVLVYQLGENFHYHDL